MTELVYSAVPTEGGWFILEVMRSGPGRQSPWTALLIDVHPDDLKNCTVDFPALFYVHPKAIAPVVVKHSNAGSN